jgi:membrane protease YdiL (CAAX protease family)
MATMAQSRGRVSGLYRALVFVLFVAGGLAIFLFGNNWTSAFPTNDLDLYKWSLPVLFGAATLALRGPQRAGLRAIALALFSAALANAVLAAVGQPLARLLPARGSVAQELAYDKIAQAIPVVLTLMVLTLIIDHDLGAVFLKRGSRWGLRFGLIAFVVFAAIFAILAVLQAGAPRTTGLTATGVPLATIVAALPWILVFIFSNSFMEELWFRGIFLGKLRPQLGVTLTLVATAFVFASPHFMATYVTDLQRLLFAAIVFGLGILNGYVMFRSDSIWGSVLVHAGYDLLVIIPLLVQLG